MKAQKIRVLVLDVDGTLTDGKVYLGDKGELFKAFNIKDGYGIVKLQETGIKVVLLTARKSNMINNRAKELGIKEVIQGKEDKLAALKDMVERFNIGFKEVAYMGDDLNDLPPIKKVGISAAPADAVKKVLDKVDFVSKHDGGDGAVREFCEFLSRK